MTTRKKASDIWVRLGIVGELLRFLWRRKLWWMIPMIVILALFVMLSVFAQESALIQFLYPLF